MSLTTIGLVAGWLLAGTGGLAGISSFITGRATARKFDAEALTLSFRAGVDSAEVLSKSAAGIGSAAEAMLKPLSEQVTYLSAQLVGANTEIAALRSELATARAEIAAMQHRFAT